MRPITLSLAAALMISPVASSRASAGGHHHGGGGHGHGGGGGNHQEATVQGAGQRNAFSFGGMVKLKGNKARGHFVIVAHPLAPQGTTLTVACKYKKFSEVTITATNASFRAEGRCERLMTNGTLEPSDSIAVVQIANGDATDTIDVAPVGPGIAIDGGTLDFGNFELDPI